MSVFDTKNNKAICVLPWIHDFSTIQGAKAPCCYANPLQNNQTMQQVRDQMLAGVQHPACTTCYVKEQKSGWSQRLLETSDWIAKHGEPDTNNPKVNSIDVRFDNTCNLKCKMCGPHSSTLWQKELGIKIKPGTDNKKYFTGMEKKELKKVYMAGGEPTYITTYLEFLEELHEVNPSCEVIINSNLKRLPDRWKDVIKKFQNLTVVCSCDATEKLASYWRYPLQWDEFSDNVRFVSEHANCLEFNLVASNMTTHMIHDTCTWMAKFTKNIVIEIIRQPDHFTEAAVPLHTRKRYIEQIDKIQHFPVALYQAPRFRSVSRWLLKKYHSTPYSPTLHKKLADEIAKQDANRTLKLQEVDHFLNDWIHG